RKVLRGIEGLIPLQVLHEFGSNTCDRHKPRTSGLRPIDLIQDSSDGWIHGAGEIVRGCNLQQVHRALHTISANVSKVALLRSRGEHGLCQRLRAGLRLDFVISKEEQFVLERTKELKQRPTDCSNHVVIADLSA